MSELVHFLAHALELESRAGERYGRLARHMEGLGKPEVAALFGRMGEFSFRHAGEIRRLALPQGPLPRLSSWQFDWPDPEPPEVGDLARTHADMTVEEALDFAIANERSGRDYYLRMALSAADARTRRMAAGFAGEESEHVQILERWLETITPPS